MFDKTIWKGCTEGPLGFPMLDEDARELDDLLDKQPDGSEWEYRRAFQSKASTEIVTGERADISVITSDVLDRDREVVIPTGVNLGQFRKNPVVTFAHRYDDLPVGRAAWIRTDRAANTIRAKTLYSTRPVEWQGDWFVDAVWHLVQAGDLRGKSIGFLPLEGRSPTPDDLKARPELADARFIFSKVLLLEYAIAPVQSNQEALVEVVSKGLVDKKTLAALGLEVPEIADDEPELVHGVDEGEVLPCEKEIPHGGILTMTNLCEALVKRVSVAVDSRINLEAVATMGMNAIDRIKGKV